MAAEIVVYNSVVLTVNGEAFPDFGSLVVPVKGEVASITDGEGAILRRVRVPAGESVTPWEWADTEGFTLMAIKVEGGDGFVQVALRYNAPTSTDDLTPTGSINHWKDRSLSCVGVAMWDTERAYIHATAATAVGETSDIPTVWGNGSKVLGVADRLAILNEGDEDVVVTMLVVPK